METGDSNTLGGPEEIEGPLLINLMEPLVAADNVSHGRTSGDLLGDRVKTVDPTSRQRNNSARSTDENTGDILFDQLLIPGWMGDRYVAGSAKVFDHEVGVRGNNTSRASDHLPVYADLGDAISEIRIVSLLPNPTGEDAGHEEVTIGNTTASTLNLSGWKLRDASSNQFSLSGAVQAGGKITITMTSNSMPLTNSGDEISLIDLLGTVRHQVSYISSQAKPGQVIVFQ